MARADRNPDGTVCHQWYHCNKCIQHNAHMEMEKIESHAQKEKKKDMINDQKTVRKSTDIGPITYQREMWKVPKDSIYAAISSLVKGMEYAQQALTEHDINFGRKTRTKRLMAELIEKDIVEIDKTLAELKGLP